VSTVSGTRWYMRHGSRIRGPMAEQQIRSLFDRGRVEKSAYLSKDRKEWVPVTTIEWLYGGAGTDASDEWSGGDAHDERQWYYSAAGQKSHSLPQSALAAMFVSGQLPSNTLVWTDGWESWRAASDLPEFASSTSVKRPFLSRFSNRAKVAMCVAGLAVLVAPIAFFMMLAGNREELQQQQAEIDRQSAEKAADRKFQKEQTDTLAQTYATGEARRKKDISDGEARTAKTIAAADAKNEKNHQEQIANSNKNAAAQADLANQQTDAINKQTNATNANTDAINNLKNGH